MTRRFFILLSIILTMIGCGRSRKAPVRITQASDSLYTARAAMKIYGTQPDRALAIVDSALIVGNVSEFRADFLRAKILGSQKGVQRSAAIILCEKLLQHDSTQVVDKRTAVNRNDVLDVMLGACRTNGDDDKWLRYAIERAELCRSMGMETESLRMEAEIGAAMTRMGRREEGMIRMEKAINALEKGDPSVDRMDAVIVARKRRIVVLDHANRYQDIIPDAEAIIRKLDDYESRPSAYAEDSFRLRPDKNAHSSYCQFYRAQAQCFLARAYTMIAPPDMVKARKYVRMVEESDYGHTFSGRWMLSQVWKSLGEWDKVLSVDQEAERLMEGDTLNTDFATILKDRADAAKARGHYSQALSYMDRYTGLKLQLSEQRLESEVQDYAARYHAMEQEQKIREAESESAHKGAVIQVIGLILLISTAFAIYSMRQRHVIVRKNKALARMIGELSSAGVSSEADTPKPDKELFDQIDGIIRKEKLYTNVNLQRQDIVSRFGISRHALNDLFTAYADGQSFTAYINGIRMQDAIRMMQKEPDTPIGAIAEAVGFTPANFREQFKRQYGMTPTEYRQNA